MFGENCDFLVPRLQYNADVEGEHVEIRRDVGYERNKNGGRGLPGMCRKFDCMFSRFDRAPVCIGLAGEQRDRHIDRHIG